MNHQCSIREDVNGRNSRFGQLRQEAISSRQVGATPRRGELHEIHNPRIVNFCLKGIRIYDNVFRSEAEMQDRGWEAMQILQSISNVTKYTHLSSRFGVCFQ